MSGAYLKTNGIIRRGFTADDRTVAPVMSHDLHVNTEFALWPFWSFSSNLMMLSSIKRLIFFAHG